MSFAMAERQATRINGQYSEMAKCEVCGKSVGASYFSAPSSGITGKGLVLCKKCCSAWEAAEQTNQLNSGE